VVSKDWERICIHIVHDSLEDYFILSVKLLKRANYSSFDNEESIPDRICFQEELQTEIKRALLFFRVDPRAAYKMFRRAMKEDITIHRNEDGRILVVRSKGMEKLNERLNKQPTSYVHQHTQHSSNGMYGEGRGYRGYEGYGNWD
jgi:hypothetical protein